MQPAAWGPPLWFFLHTMSHNFPENPTPEIKAMYRDFFVSLGHVLPCKHCRDSYQAITRDLDLNVFKSRRSLSRWVYDLHNTINLKLRKPCGPSYGAVARSYEALRAGNPKVKARIALFPRD
jgi:hypothetical protein